MTRDIEDRLALFSEGTVEVNRIALNMDQIERYNPPPNPAKITDSRAHGYIQKFGSESWELDALEPSVLDALIDHTISTYRDDDLWEESKAKQEKHRKALEKAAKALPKE